MNNDNPKYEQLDTQRERESLEIFADALGSPLTIRMRKIFFERTMEDLGLHLIADPAEPNVLIMPVQGDGEIITNLPAKVSIAKFKLNFIVNNLSAK